MSQATGIPRNAGYAADVTRDYPTKQAATKMPQRASEPSGQYAALDAANQVLKESLAGITTQSRMYPDVPSANVSEDRAAFSSRWVLPNELSPEDQHVVTVVRELFECTTMADHHKAFANLARNVTWDAPPFMIHNRDAMRDIAYVAKTGAHMKFKVFYAKSEILDPYTRRLHLEITIHVRPHLGPLQFLSPEGIPIRASLIVGRVKSPQEPQGSFGLINWVRGRIHNVPALPTLLRLFLGYGIGYPLMLSEPIWRKGLPLLGDHTAQDWEQGAGPAARNPY